MVAHECIICYSSICGMSFIFRTTLLPQPSLRVGHPVRKSTWNLQALLTVKCHRHRPQLVSGWIILKCLDPGCTQRAGSLQLLEGCLRLCAGCAQQWKVCRRCTLEDALRFSITVSSVLADMHQARARKGTFSCRKVLFAGLAGYHCSVCLESDFTATERMRLGHSVQIQQEGF